MISIIVPVYNVEKYIKKCIDSILSQTFTDFELLLIDDGSTDDSSNICDYYLKRDNRIRVFHQKNSGLSCARNTGITISNGDYLTFIDSDDYVDPQYLSILYDNLISTESDISACCYLKFTDAQNPISVFTNSIKTVDENGYWYINEDGFSDVSCCKLFKRHVFNNVVFPPKRIHEDDFVIHHLVHNSRRICITLDKLYFYRQREGSIMKAVGSFKSLCDSFDAYADRIIYFLMLLDNELINIYFHKVLDRNIRMFNNRYWIRNCVQVFSYWRKLKRLYYIIKKNKYSIIISKTNRLFIISPLIFTFVKKITKKPCR